MSLLNKRPRREFLRHTLGTAGALSLSGAMPARANATVSNRGQYDYIVIGTGSAGSVLIRRLIDAGFRVLALEAGPSDRMAAIHEPPLVTQLYGSAVDWSFRTMPQSYSANQDISWSRGKTLGGSSAINGMMYVRGLPRDFDGWAYSGATGWAWRDVEPYFRKLENFQLPDPMCVHGHRGPQQIGRPEMTALAHDFVTAAIAAGIPSRDDYNDGRDSTGVGLSQLTILPNGQRASAWTCYVDPIKSDPRLTVITQARVLNLVINGTCVTGVRFAYRGEIIVARADRETLLCAGSIMSPSVLLHSGIGPAKDLSSLGIRPIIDLPGVGENLHDQLTCWTVWETMRHNSSSVTTGMEATVFLNSDAALDGPDGQVLLSTNTFPIDGYPVVKQGFTLVPTVLAPRSRGWVRLASADPFAYPIIDPRACEDSYDVEVVARYAMQIRNVMRQPEFMSWGAREVSPGPSVTTQAEMEAYVRKTATTADHQVGTAKMGSDAMSVVDSELRVHGLSNLRVVDASVMPTVTSGNTNAPTIMIAEKAADLILQSIR
ncbi:GMC family oxidoreductase [Burkholderia cepacia]|uniref:GMC family oxidoreductase n=1 Tax=Burkholderia cepacia TaxID=292 RepID=UPI002AB60656|nr:GMC oxidoreductase [Burkholderia cepacia]